jgi:hypothetical protein
MFEGEWRSETGEVGRGRHFDVQMKIICPPE